MPAPLFREVSRVVQTGPDLAGAYLAAVSAGQLPDSLLTADFSAWLAAKGPVSQEMYQGAVRMLARICREPIRFTVDAITAEADRVLIEARSTTTLVNGEPYENTYVFSLRIRDGKIAADRGTLQCDHRDGETVSADGGIPRGLTLPAPAGGATAHQRYCLAHLLRSPALQAATSARQRSMACSYSRWRR